MSFFGGFGLQGARVRGVDGDVEQEPGDEPGASAAGNAWERNQAPRKRMRGSRADIQAPDADSGSASVETTSMVKRPPAALQPTMAKRARDSGVESFHRVPVEVFVDDLPTKWVQDRNIIIGVGNSWTASSNNLIQFPIPAAGTGNNQRVGQNVIGRCLCARLWLEGTLTSDRWCAWRVVIFKMVGKTTNFTYTSMADIFIRDLATGLGDINSIPDPSFFGDDKPFQILVDDVVLVEPRSVAVSTIGVKYRSYHIDLNNEVWQFQTAGTADVQPQYFMALCSVGFGTGQFFYNIATMFSEF